MASNQQNARLSSPKDADALAKRLRALVSETHEGAHDVVSIEVFSTEETDLLGALVADVLPDGAVVALQGTLGAGKTRFVQAVAQALGVPPEDVTSPTFVLIQEYLSGKRPVFHFDTYRLKDEDEFLELGPDEYFLAGGLTFIEWAERVQNCLPPTFFLIEIEHSGESQRTFRLSKKTTL
ncbi:MAG: tRNA (adenosine(37)-N6)-threonylcarbamoyltransferase complex ATPase subunit type 1 TsaE [Planctomycetia bacterium]|nr:tRNA (adenosine(37)-N6)-threonylcarbamoyltransferase complex ATPase subunit type 1 TsaE [Planctomycetia bacterium]